MDDSLSILRELEALIERRKREASPDSYVARMLAADADTILKKIVEEAAETALAARVEDREKITREAADLIFHLLIALARYNVPLAAVARELQNRRRESESESRA